MDLGRRASRKGKARSVVLFLLAFGLCAGCFAAMFLFGNAGALWVLGVYAFGLTLWILNQWKNAEGNHRLWLSGLRGQSEQGPGFSALEAEAINELLLQMGTEGQGLRRHLAASEVVARYNSGAGCVTTFRSPAPHEAIGDLGKYVTWFELADLHCAVGARLWSDDDGLVTTLEFFTGGEDTRRLNWIEVAFRSAGPERERPSIPQMRPIQVEPRWVRYRPDAS